MKKKTSITSLLKKKQNGEKFTALTAYDTSFAQIFDEQGIDVILIGDSLGMVLQGNNDTLKVTIDDMAYHTRCVAAGASSAFILADMPFMSYATPEQACLNAAKLMQAGAQMVKLEGAAWLKETIETLTQRSVPVCAHLGLTPQSVHVFGGYKIQGRENNAAQQMIQDAIDLEKAGAQMILLECVPASLAKAITEAVSVPVCGIGAGADTDGQVLVMHDILGISSGYIPKFSKNYLTETGDIRKAVTQFITEVSEGAFPATEHIFE
ncbi:3-methyl-2-oxobutanoate hydroxymethyltransferase [Saccharobesus litoralis]|uniref:3-methyl-2-oxobutanoate hydroxymethyltransferase n=1 Tax=Saccharobesus litoralis TaxID=2172099 RepID=A0A2S0VSG0_9ALTE|nr:3-methyl-2-oxobutanoate hydroxymethyltransferase [Saccharobesus litoralis]AWB67040.1 3-methyl-2-oxobutanoate hydroxymethyltransferase [Saccharobesus litoralis]